MIRQLSMAVLCLGLLATGCIMYRPFEYAIKDLKRLYAASQMYAMEHEGQIPPTIDDAARYIGSPHWVNHYEMVAKGRWDVIERSSDVILIRKKMANTSGNYMVVFGDGRCGKTKTK